VDRAPWSAPQRVALVSGKSRAQKQMSGGHAPPLRGLLFRLGVSVMSDAVAMVPTGGELTLFEAVGRARA
jgi:hypothetical protein